MPTPHAETFRRSVDSGLLLPPELSRERQVWTKQEWKLLERCTVLLHQKGVDLLMKCRHPKCADQPLQGQRVPGGDFHLRCEHADRVMTKAF